MSRMSARKVINVVPAVVAAAGIAVTYIAYAPGLMPHDALGQFHQAQTGHFDDVHPPIMAWLWSELNAVIPGPEGFFLLLIVLYWLGFFLLIRNLLRVSAVRAAIASVLPFSPILFNFAGTIWKDVLVFGCFLVATEIILARPSKGAARFPLVPSLIVLILFLLGALARWNSVPGVVPLLVLALWPQPPARAPLRRTVYRLALCLPVVMLAWATSGKLLDVAVIHAEKTGFANMLPLWDLVGMSHNLEKNLVPGSWSEGQSEQIIRFCYHPIADNGLGMPKSPCYFIHKKLMQDDYWHAMVLFPLWAKAILRHPKAYFDTRLSYVRTLFWPNNIFMFNADDGTNAFNHHPNLLFQTEKQVLRFCGTAPVLHLLFTLAFWMIVTAILTAAFAIAVARGKTGCYPSLLLSLSAGINLWPLVIIGPDGQFRFAYWSIAASCIALLTARGDIATGDEAGTGPPLAS